MIFRWRRIALRPRFVLVVALLLVSAIFLAFPVTDIWISHFFYFPGKGFAFQTDPDLQLLRELGKLATISVIVCAIGALCMPFIVRRTLPGLSPSRALYLLTVYAVGPGLLVNLFFKDFFDRARPRELVQFGGFADFTQIWAVPGSCSYNCSFTSGEAASAAALLTLVFLVPRAYRFSTGAIITLFAGFVSLNRIAVGGHFLSDTLLSWIVVLLVAFLIKPMFFGARGNALDDRYMRFCRALLPFSRPDPVPFEERPWTGEEDPFVGPSPFIERAHEREDRGFSASDVVPGGLRFPRKAFETISVIVPARNEAENLSILVPEIAAALAQRDHEILVVDDGSSDETGSTLADLATRIKGLRHIRHDRSSGQSRAICSGVRAARGDLIVTIDGDGQNDPLFINDLVAALEAAGDGTGLAAGQRVGRTDTRLKQLSSRMANGLRTAILKDATRDTGCGLKAIPADLFRRLPFFDGWHRYLPALVMREGYAVVHVDVKDRSRRFGRSNYGILDRGLRGVLDLAGVWWLRRRSSTLPTVNEFTLDEHDGKTPR